MPDPAFSIKSLLLFIIFFLSLIACETDPDLVNPLDTDRFVTFDQSSGLAGDQVRDICLDSRGNLWFACFGNGITRYDGSTFTLYNSGNSGLGNNRVICITEDPDGNMWFGTDNRIFILVNQKDWYYLDLIDTLEVRTNVLYTDGDGTIWIGTEGAGFFYFDQGALQGPYAFADPTQLNNVNDISLDEEGYLWLATDYGLAYYNGQSWDITPLPAGIEFNSLYLDPRGKLWIGVSGGSDFLYYSSGEFFIINQMNGQSNIFVNDIGSDLNGNIWIATNLDGVIRYDGVVMNTYKPYNGFASDNNYCIETDRNGNVWIGTYNKGAIKYIPPVIY